MIESVKSRAISTQRLWTSRIVYAWIVLFLAFDTAVKVFKLSVAVEGTTRLGFPENLVVPLGLVELICLIAYLVPRTAVLGAILLTGYLGGATATQVRVQDLWFVFPAAIAVLVWGALWLRDPGLHETLFPGPRSRSM
jgi:hypothetical protein